MDQQEQAVADVVSEATTTHWWETDCCFRCTYWGGSREKTQAMIDEWMREGYNLEFLSGWMDGRCANGPDGINVEVHGDAWAEVTMDAEFGCLGFGVRG